MLREKRLLVQIAVLKSPYFLNAFLMKNQIQENFLIPSVLRLAFKCVSVIGEVTAMLGDSEIYEACLEKLFQEGKGFCLDMNDFCKGSSFFTFCSFLWLCQVTSKQNT